MPQIDIIHMAVRRALEKQGWRLVTEHLYLEEGGYSVYIDLALERDDPDGQGRVESVVVEVKSFIRSSFINDFQDALGQYLVYQDQLEVRDDPRLLFLALPLEVFRAHFTQPRIERMAQRYHLHLLVVDTYNEEVHQWIVN